MINPEGPHFDDNVAWLGLRLWDFFDDEAVETTEVIEVHMVLPDLRAHPIGREELRPAAIMLVWSVMIYVFTGKRGVE